MRVDFVRLANLGYSRLVPVIPPDGQLPSDASPELIASRGKVPGTLTRTQSGAPGPCFTPLKGWRNYQLTENDAHWHTNAGCNAGLILGPASNVYCLDLDISDERVASVAHQALLQLFQGNHQPYRVGNWPKASYYFRGPSGPGIRRMRVKLADAHGTEHLIELLGEGQQSVIAGTHPKTHQPFQWAIPGIADYSPIPPNITTLAQLDLTRLSQLPLLIADALTTHAQCRVLASEGRASGGATKPQAELLAPSLEALRAAVEALPNRHDLFPTRASYLNVGYAIKAAAGAEHEDEAFSIWLEWCERWDHGSNDFEVVAKDWRGIVGDLRIGWNWLVQRARECGVELAGLVFDAAPLPEEHGLLGPAPEDATVAYSQDDCAQRVVLEHQWQYGLKPINSRATECHRWNGKHWEHDVGAVHLRHDIRMTARRMAQQLLTAEPSQANINRARGFMSLQFLNGVLGVLGSYPIFNATTIRFDANPWLLNTPDGIINLPTGKLSPHDAKQFCANITNVTPKLNPSADEWSYTRAWMRQIACGDAELELFLYRLCALAITGYVGVQRWYVMLGRGGNGKSTLLNLLSYILGTYAVTVNAETFQVQRNGKDYGLARMDGKRLVIAIEAAGQAVWNTTLLAGITGGDAIQAEEKYKAPATFNPCAKVVIATTSMPRLRTIDHALQRRFTCIPFDAEFGLDPSVPDKLKAEAPAFLGQLIQLAAQLYAAHARKLPAEHLLPLPPAVREASALELEEQDLVGQWRAQFIVTDNPEDFIPSRTVVEHFTRTMLARNNRDWPDNQIIHELVKRGHRRMRKGGDRVRVLMGMRFKPEHDAQSQFDAHDATNVITFPKQSTATLGPDIEEQLS